MDKSLCWNHYCSTFVKRRLFLFETFLLSKLTLKTINSVDIKIDTKSMLRCCQNIVYLFVKWDILWLEYILAMLDICYVSLQFIKRRI